MEENDVISSWICLHINRFRQKTNEVNQLLAEKCGKNDFNYMLHNNVDTRLHFNRDDIHVNRKGVNQISCNVKGYLNNG